MTNIEAWFPELHEEVEHSISRQVGRVTHINPGVDDEVRVRWAISRPSWISVQLLRPFDRG